MKTIAFDTFNERIEDAIDDYKTGLIDKYRSIIRTERSKLTEDQIVEYFRNKESNLPQSDVRVANICELSQPRFKPAIIFDDVSDMLGSCAKSTQTITINGENFKIKNLYDKLLSVIFTRGRHFGALIYMAVHTVHDLPTTQKQSIANFVLNSSGFDAFGASRTLITTTKLAVIKPLIPMLDRYNQDHKTKYNLIYFKDARESPDGKSNLVFY